MAKQRRQTRRSPGEGTVSFDGETWIAKIQIDGKYVKRRAASEQAAKAKLKELQELRDQDIDVGGSQQRLADWLNAWYGQICETKAIKPRTQEHYRSMIERYILPRLGDMRLCDIRPDHIQQALLAIRDDIRSHTMYDGTQTARAVADVIRQSFQLAEDRRILLRTPYRGILLPKSDPKTIVPLDDDQVRALLTAASGTRFDALWHIYALLGLRRGEGLGLMWADLDWRATTLRIERQVNIVDGKPVLTAPKTDSGKRLLPIPQVLLTLLDAHQQRQQNEWMAHGLAWTGQGLIFPSLVNTMLWPCNIEREFYDLRDAAKLPTTITLHALRHTTATLLDEVGASEALKAGILGHKTQTITQRYTHARLAAMRAVLDALSVRVLRLAA